MLSLWNSVTTDELAQILKAAAWNRNTNFSLPTALFISNVQIAEVSKPAKLRWVSCNVTVNYCENKPPFITKHSEWPVAGHLLKGSIICNFKCNSLFLTW